jgi:uncharacterized protein YgiM (DUF1202 family)
MGNLIHVHGSIAPTFMPANLHIRTTDRRVPRAPVAHPGWLFRGLVVGLLLLIVLASAACARSQASPTASPAAREATLRQIAADYAADGDLGKAQVALAALQLANPGQLLVTLAEQDISEGRALDEIAPLARLAEALGARSPRLIAYLAPTATASPVPPPSAAPPTATPVPTTIPATSAPTVPPATATPAPPSATPTLQQPRVVANNVVNLRAGPGTAYPIVGRVQAGQEYDIISRNASGDWWQLAWDGPGQAWVASVVVAVRGPIDTVAVAQNVPPPPTPKPTQPPQPTQPPKPSVAYVVKSLRLRSVGEDAQRCNGGDHNIFVLVVDPAGNPLDGVRVREIFSGQIFVTGNQGKGPGRVQYDIFRGGGGQVDVVDEAGNRISEVTRGMSDDWPDFDLMKAAGYCNCKPHPDDASCEADLVNHTYLFAVGHYVYEVVFQRTW